MIVRLIIVPPGQRVSSTSMALAALLSGCFISGTYLKAERALGCSLTALTGVCSLQS